MALPNPIGYDGSVDEQDWANLARYLGKEPCTLGATGWQVTAVTGLDRTVRIATGTGYGWGVLDTNPTSADLQLSTITSGVRWDTVVARRDWQPTPGGGTNFLVVKGNSSKALAAGLLSTPGVQADQPLALVQVTAGVSTPTAVIDLRRDLDGNFANSDAPALLGGGHIGDRGWNPFLYWSTLGKQTFQAQYAVRGGEFRMRGDVSPTKVNAWVGPGDKGIGTIPAGFEPAVPFRGPVACLGATPADLTTVRAVVGTDGSMSIYVPNGYTVQGVALDGIRYSLEA